MQFERERERGREREREGVKRGGRCFFPILGAPGGEGERERGERVVYLIFSFLATRPSGSVSPPPFTRKHTPAPPSNTHTSAGERERERESVFLCVCACEEEQKNRIPPPSKKHGKQVFNSLSAVPRLPVRGDVEHVVAPNEGVAVLGLELAVDVFLMMTRERGGGGGVGEKTR